MLDFVCRVHPPMTLQQAAVIAQYMNGEGGRGIRRLDAARFNRAQQEMAVDISLTLNLSFRSWVNCTNCRQQQEHLWAQWGKVLTSSVR